MTMGVYLIRNTANSAVYVGSSSDVERRLKHHWYLLTKGTHYNPRLQADWTRQGVECFAVEVVAEISDPAELIVFERERIESMRSEGLMLYNEAGPVIDYRPRRHRRFEPAVIERVRQEMGYEGASSARARGHELLDCVREEDLDETVGFLRQFLAVRGYDVWAGG